LWLQFFWLQRTSDIMYCFLESLEVRYNEVLLYLSNEQLQMNLSITFSHVAVHSHSVVIRPVVTIRCKEPQNIQQQACPAVQFHQSQHHTTTMDNNMQCSHLPTLLQRQETAEHLLLSCPRRQWNISTISRNLRSQTWLKIIRIHCNSCLFGVSTSS